MASDKALPVLPLRTSSAPGVHRARNDPCQYVYEDPRELWVHHRKASQGETSLGTGYLPAQRQPGYGRQYPQYPHYRQNRQSSLPVYYNSLGIRPGVSDHAYGPHQLRRTTRTLPTHDILPPSPESPLEVLPLFARESPLYTQAIPIDYRAFCRSTSPALPRHRAATANLAGQSYYGSAPGEVSPPSSPEAGHSNDPRDVSPIDEVPDMSALSRPRQSSAPSQPKSNIPMMRRQRRHEQDAANAMLRGSKSRERLRSSSLQQPAQEVQEGGSGEATGRQVFKVAQGREMRWDAMTGEPTLGSTGLSGQVKPAEYAQGLKASSKPASSASAALERLRNAQSSFGEKVKKLTSPTATQTPVSPAPEPEPEHVSDAQAPVAQPTSSLPTSPPPTTTRPPRKSSLGNSAPAARPEWKGGSGRTTLVAPVQDTPQPAPLHIPRKSSKRERVAHRGRGAGKGQPLSPISPSTSETSLHRPDPTAGTVTSPQQATLSPNLDGRTAAGEEYPSPPHSGPAADPDKVSASPTTPVSMSIDNAKATKRKPPSAAAAANASHHNPHFSVASSMYSTFDTTTVPHPSGAANITVTTRVPKAPERPAATTPPAEDNWVPPPSRFSITTYATSAHTRSPGASVDLDAPPVPIPPQEYTQSPQSKDGSSEPAAYMSSPYTSPAAEMRRAAALGQDNTPSYLRTGAWPNATPSIMSERPGSVASTSKALPPAPPEMQTVNDRVGNLNARLESLANRRININKSIVKMTEMMPTDNLMASDAVLRKREVEKMKVEGLRAELAEVQRMEYELGLKLHRAYKRQDRDAEYEPTTLWVRRVTG